LEASVEDWHDEGQGRHIDHVDEGCVEECIQGFGCMRIGIVDSLNKEKPYKHTEPIL